MFKSNDIFSYWRKNFSSTGTLCSPASRNSFELTGTARIPVGVDPLNFLMFEFVTGKEDPEIVSGQTKQRVFVWCAQHINLQTVWQALFSFFFFFTLLLENIKPLKKILIHLTKEWARSKSIIANLFSITYEREGGKERERERERDWERD